MFTERQNKVSKLIQKDISDIFVKHGKEWFGSVMVTVTMVRITKDLSIAKVYISVFPSTKAEEVVELLNFNVKKVRYELGNRIRHQLKNVPELQFYKDDSLDHMEKIDKLLNG
jgi:ribosome-binding factor A